MRPFRISALVVTVAALSACGAAPAPGAGSPGAANSPTTSAAGPTPSPTAEPTPDARPLQSLLPADFRGTEAHTFSVGQEMLAHLATAIGVRRRALQAAYASDHGPAFVQMYALRVRGHDPQELLDALPQAAYPNAPADSITVEAGQLGDRQVTVISHSGQAATIGSFYAFTNGDTLIVAQAFAEPVAEAAFEELPPS